MHYPARLPLLASLLLPGAACAPLAARAQAAHEHEHHPAPAATTPMPMPAEAMPAHAGHMGMFEFGPLADTQDASGTAWQPADTPMHAIHSMRGDWMVMTHYNVFLAYDNQSGRRGGEQVNSTNWLMLMATKRAAENELTFRGMFSLEPWTTTTKGYPLLLQSGESYQGRPLVDRQHPHDFFMELAARYRRLVNPETLLSLYVAPSGEPALGPPAFMHRASALDNPASPISHHWLDSTHISFGVLTAGVARKTWQLEGSWFNGREPDERRWGIDLTRLDSYSGRFTWNPTANWSAQVSHGYLESPEELHPEERLRRTTASIIHSTKLSRDAHLATTLGWGRNDHGADQGDAWLAESTYSTPRQSFFARAEQVDKLGEELDVPPDHAKFRVRQLTLGMTHELVDGHPCQLALGGSLTWSLLPDSLERLYGSRPIGFWLFLRLRPAAMKH